MALASAEIGKLTWRWPPLCLRERAESSAGLWLEGEERLRVQERRQQVLPTADDKLPVRGLVECEYEYVGLACWLSFAGRGRKKVVVMRHSQSRCCRRRRLRL